MSLAVAILIVVGAVAATALAFVLVYRSLSGPVLDDSGRGRPMIDMVSVTFAVVLAFVIFSAFQTYDGAKSGAASEANAVLAMARTAALFPPSERDQLRSDFLCYGRAVVNQEWPAMRQGHSSPLVDHWIGAYRAAFARLTLRSPREQLAFQDLLTQAGNRTTARQQRLSVATPAVPTPLWLALLFGGFVAVALQFAMADRRERLSVQALMLSGVAAVVASGLLIVYILDHPYQSQSGGIPPSTMRHTLVMVRNLEPSLHPACSESGRPS